MTGRGQAAQQPSAAAPAAAAAPCSCCGPGTPPAAAAGPPAPLAHRPRAPRAAGSARKTSPLVSWKKQTHWKPAARQDSARPVDGGRAGWGQAAERWRMSGRWQRRVGRRRREGRRPAAPRARGWAAAALQLTARARLTDRQASAPRTRGVQQHVHVAVAVRLGLHRILVACLQRQPRVVVCVRVGVGWRAARLNGTARAPPALAAHFLQQPGHLHTRAAPKAPPWY